MTLHHYIGVYQQTFWAKVALLFERAPFPIWPRSETEEGRLHNQIASPRPTRPDPTPLSDVAVAATDKTAPLN